MATTIHLDETDDAITLAAILSSMDSLDVFNDPEEMVAQRVIEACLEDIPGADIDELDRHAEDLKHRLTTKAQSS